MSGLDTGAIVGIVIALLIVVAMIIALIVKLLKPSAVTKSNYVKDTDVENKPIAHTPSSPTAE